MYNITQYTKKVLNKGIIYIQEKYTYMHITRIFRTRESLMHAQLSYYYL